ncbi:hypothetical protein SAMN04487818_108244 [Actinokineospora terrae]|uniref:Uncharacterized protein n=2 Tax=Actinokineospora terrae TaxID=155974 RepID=A0A1H9VBV8_9PSEU|nr:hypothetical protein SAMN04487818_108244 [Actinokineospora terrae]
MMRNPRSEVCWGTNTTHGGRAHVVLHGSSTGLCGQPVDTRYQDRPTARPVCPDCAISYVAAVFPTEVTAPDLRHEVRLRA